MIETPVPSNIQEVKKMDEFNLQLLKEKHQKTLLAQDLIYKKIQKKSQDVFGQLSVFGTGKKRGQQFNNCQINLF